MKIKLLFQLSCLLGTHFLSAQTFTESSNTFEGVSGSSVSFSDMNGDNASDLLITGIVSGNVVAKLYFNDGEGNFVEVSSTPFEGVQGTPNCMTLADIDNDGDQDVLITGQNITPIRIAKLYTNDGTGSFTEVSGTPFEGVYSGSVAFADVDDDDDLDLFIIGRITGTLTPIAKLYANDGTGNFIEVLGTPFVGTLGSSIAFADVDNDNDPDLLLSGLTQSGPPITKLFINDGGGNFTEAIGTPFVNVESGSIAFADVDGDTDKDVLISGRGFSQVLYTKLYTNDGLGNYTEAINTPFEGLHFSSLAFADVDGDNDQDVLITGKINNDSAISKLFINDGLGNFSEVMGLPFEDVSSGAIAFSDVDGDSDNDVIITGRNNSQSRITKLYLNGVVTSSVNSHRARPNLSFQILPNPVIDVINIDIAIEESSQFQLDILNGFGRLVHQQIVQLNAGNNSIVLSARNLEKGIYFVHIQNGEYNSIRKLLIQ